MGAGCAGVAATIALESKVGGDIASRTSATKQQCIVTSGWVELYLGRRSALEPREALKQKVHWPCCRGRQEDGQRSLT